MRPQDIPKHIIENFIADVRRLCIIYGSQKEAAIRLGVSDDAVNLWFNGRQLPNLSAYIKVKQLIAEEMEKGVGG